MNTKIIGQHIYSPLIFKLNWFSCKHVKLFDYKQTDSNIAMKWVSTISAWTLKLKVLTKLLCLKQFPQKLCTQLMIWIRTIVKEVVMCTYEICIPPGILTYVETLPHNGKVKQKKQQPFEKWKRSKIQRWIITCQIKHYFRCMAIQFRRYQDCQISEGWQVEAESLWWERKVKERLKGKAPADFWKIVKIAFCPKKNFVNKL